MTQSQLQPVLFGGLFIGVLSALPIVSIGNCCCLWIVGGGALTAYLLQRDRSGPLSLGEGAMGGFMAGIAGAVVYLAVSIPISIVTAPLQRGMMEFVLNSGTDVPPEVREMMESFGSEGLIASVVVGFGVMLFVGMIFSALGGLLGALIFRSSPPMSVPPPPPMSVPPPPPMSVPPVPPPPPAPEA